MIAYIGIAFVLGIYAASAAILSDTNKKPRLGRAAAIGFFTALTAFVIFVIGGSL